MLPIKSVDDIKDIGEKMKWQYFEKLVGFIFEENGFKIDLDIVIKHKGRKMQFDVVAKRGDIVFVVECKKWSRKMKRKYGIKKAAEIHAKKVNLYEEATGIRAKPIMVTLIEEDFSIHNGVPIIPIEKLNWFLNNFHEIDI